MNNIRENRNRKDLSELSQKEATKVWFCDGCSSYHIKTGSTVLTFDKQEFSEFVNETWNCFYDQEESILALY